MPAEVYPAALPFRKRCLITPSKVVRVLGRLPKFDSGSQDRHRAGARIYLPVFRLYRSRRGLAATCVVCLDLILLDDVLSPSGVVQGSMRVSRKQCEVSETTVYATSYSEEPYGALAEKRRGIPPAFNWWSDQSRRCPSRFRPMEVTGTWDEAASVAMRARSSVAASAAVSVVRLP